MSRVELMLKKYLALETEKRILVDDLEEAMDQLRHISDMMLNPSDLSKTKSSKTNVVVDKVQAAVLRITEIYDKQVKEIENRQKQIAVEQNEITGLVENAKLSVYERLYMQLRYFKNYQVREVEEELRYSVAQVWRIKLSALDKIENYLKTKDDKS